ncbi:MAG: META domain-containing protein [bacterium]
MRCVRLLVLVAFGGLGGCASAGTPKPAPTAVAPPAAASASPLTPLVGTQWVAEDISDRGVVDSVQSTLHVDSTSKVSGSGGCNRYNGAARTQSGTLMFGPIQTTRMACPEAVMKQEGLYFEALVGARAVEIDGDTLYFLDVTGSRSVRFTKMAAPPTP